MHLLHLIAESRAHLVEARETYSEHFLFTLRTGSQLLACGLIILLHGLVPALCRRTGSNWIKRLYQNLQARVPAGKESHRQENGGVEWYI